MDCQREKKAVWRRAIKELFALTPQTARIGLDADLCGRVGEFVGRGGARRLLGFSALPDEPDLASFFRRWLAGGGELALPVWQGGETMILRLVNDYDRDMCAGRGGILEPIGELPEADPDSLDLVLTPGRAFSESGDRLGRGAGCYDHLLAGRAVIKAGVAYDFQIFPELPANADDVPMDVVMTPSRLLRRD